MIKGGMTLDRKGYSLLLEASVHLQDPKVRKFDNNSHNICPDNIFDIFIPGRMARFPVLADAA